MDKQNKQMEQMDKEEYDNLKSVMPYFDNLIAVLKEKGILNQKDITKIFSG